MFFVKQGLLALTLILRLALKKFTLIFRWFSMAFPFLLGQANRDEDEYAETEFEAELDYFKLSV